MRHYIGTRVFAYSSSESTITAVPVNIGNANVKKYVNHDYKHLVGKDYPLYGIKTRVPKNKNPKFNRMSQLAALVALEIVNEGDGKANGEANIEIRNVSYEVKNENIVGGFKVDITGDEPSFANGTSPANKTTVTIVDDNDKDSFISIAPGDSAKIYFAVKPHDASGKSVTITVNGSSRTITMPANTKFKMGQATTIRVPVKLSYPKESDVLSKTNFLTFNNKNDVTLSVNGEQVSGYSLEKTKKSWSGTTYEQATLTVSGTAADLINALPAGFYASTYNGKRAAMTVTNINLHIPEYDTEGNIIKHTQIASYEPFINKVKEIVVPIIDNILGNGEEWWNGKTIWIIVPITISVRDIFVEIFKNGIPRDREPLYFTKFIDPQTITFNGIVENGSASSSDNIFILDEEPIYKGITSSQVENLLLTKFSSNGYTASFKGIKDIVNKDYTTDANNTAQAIWGKLQEEIGTMEIPLYDEVKIGVWDVFTAIFPDVTAMKTMLGDLKADITIGSYPYASDKKEYGSKAGGSLVPNKPYNPIIFWGLDVYGPDLSEPR